MIHDSKDARKKDARDHLERLRLRLLDLSGRNRFLNFRHSETSRTQLRFVDASIDQVCNLIGSSAEFQAKALRKPAELVPEEIEEARDEAPHAMDGAKSTRKRKRFNPEAVAEAARAQGIDPSFEIRLAEVAPSKSRDLQTLLFADDLERRLQAIYDEERHYIQELGINALYCCVGFLEWYEAEYSDVSRLAPLLLYPIQINRTLSGAKYQFRFSGIGDEPESNISLIERLTRDFGIRLPEYNGENDTPENYLATIAIIVAQQKNWRVRTFATVSTLNFAKLAMYRDLDPDERPADAVLEEHPVISDILAGTEMGLQSLEPDEAREDVNLLKVPLLVTEADSSQFSAIAEALSEKSLVIEGPPGTGKSQTITNIIAAAMSKGLRVLFVAEKLAALQVVKSKLDSYKLGPFCLELHSTKIRKADVHKSIADRVYLERPSMPQVESVIAQIEQQKKVLGEYTSALHSHFGKLGPPLYDLLWREQRMRLEIGDEAFEVEHFVVPHATDFDPSGLSQAMQTLEGYEATFNGVESSYGSVAAHPWHGVAATDASLEERQQFLSWLRGVAPTIDSFANEARDASTELGWKQDLPIGQWIAFGDLCKSLSGEAPSVAAHIIRSLRDSTASSVIDRFVSNIEAESEIESRYGIHLLTALRDPGEAAEVVRTVIAGGLGHVALKDLVATSDDLRAQIDELQSLQSYLRDVEIALGASSHPAIVALKACGELLETTDRAALVAKSPVLMDEQHYNELRRIIAEGTQLAQSDADFRSRYDLDGLPAPESLKAAARSLRDGGPFWWLNSGVRSARRLYRQHSLQNDRVSNTKLAEQLTELAEFLIAANAFIDSQRNLQLLGDLFRGLRTDFKLVDAIVSFAARTRELTAKDTEWNSRLRAALLNAGASEADRISALFVDQRLEAATANTAEDVTEREGRATALLSRLGKLRDIVGRLDLKGTTTVDDFAKLLGESSRYHDLGLRIAGDGAAKSILHEQFNAARQSSTDLRKALNYAAILNRSDLPEPLKDRLASCEPESDKSPITAFARYWEAQQALVLGALNALEQNSLLDRKQFFGHADLRVVGLEFLVDRTERALKNAESLEDWVRFSRIRERALKAAGPIIRYYEERSPRPRTPLHQCFEYLVIRSVVRAAVDRFPALRDFPGVTLSQARQTFRELDQQLIEMYRRKLAAQLHSQRVDPGNSSV